ncbi:universal stress protein [Halobacteriales archaeon QH_10_65_19]|nr:MAG: universal stress protein [Halobacteriales archaeon QH_10_65_19]
MRVIVGVDGTDHGIRALDRTIERAREAGDEVTVAVYATGDASLDEIEASVRDRLETRSFDAAIEPITGSPGSRLVELAEEGDYDRIVLSGGHRSPLGKIQLGSTLEFVLVNARTTVTLVR